MTREELRDYVLDRLAISSGDTSRVTQINGLLSREYLRIVREERLGIATADLIFTAGDPLVDLPDDLMEIITIRRGETALRPVNRERMLSLEADRQGSAQADDPQVYAFEAPTRIRVEPAPTENDATGATLVYVAKPASQNAAPAYGLAHDDDEPALLPEEFHDLIAERVIERIAASEEEAEQVAIAGAMSASLRAGLSSSMNRRSGRASSHIRPRGYRPR